MLDSQLVIVVQFSSLYFLPLRFSFSSGSSLNLTLILEPRSQTNKILKSNIKDLKIHLNSQQFLDFFGKYIEMR